MNCKKVLNCTDNTVFFPVVKQKSFEIGARMLCTYCSTESGHEFNIVASLRSTPSLRCFHNYGDEKLRPTLRRSRAVTRFP